MDLVHGNEISSDTTEDNEDTDEGKYDKIEFKYQCNPFNQDDDFNLPSFLDRFRSLDADEVKFLRENTNIGDRVDNVFQDDEIALSRFGLDDDWKIK